MTLIKRARQVQLAKTEAQRRIDSLLCGVWLGSVLGFALAGGGWLFWAMVVPALVCSLVVACVDSASGED